MKRKLVKQGENAITVTLPSNWIKANNLSPKDEIDISEEGNHLLISTDMKKVAKKTNITLKSSDQKYIDALFRNFYINGYDEIYVKFRSNDEYLKIINSIEPLIGYEIDTKKKESCFVKNLSDFEESDYESIFKKIIYIIFTMEELTENLIESKEEEYDKEQMIQLNKDSSKFSCFCRRVIFKTNLLKNEEALTKYTIINTLHMIARNCFTIYNEIKNKSLKISKKEKEYFKKIESHFKLLFDAYKNNNLDLTNEVISKRRKLKNMGLTLAKTEKNFDFLHYLMEIVRLNGTIAGKIGFLSTLKK